MLSFVTETPVTSALSEDVVSSHDEVPVLETAISATSEANHFGPDVSSSSEAQWHGSFGELEDTAAPAASVNSNLTEARWTNGTSTRVWESATVDPRTALTRQIPRGPAHETITPQLWNTFVTHCVVEIVPSMSGQINPFLQHLASRARAEPTLFAAVLYLSQTIIIKCTSRPLGKRLSSPDMQGQVEGLAMALEKQAVRDIESPSAGQIIGTQATSSLLTQLSTMVTLCTAYITRGDTAKLLMLLENALVLAQSMFKEHLQNETFRFLLKWLGYIHTVSMLSSGEYNIKGPDYFGIATGFKDSSSLMDTFDFGLSLADLGNTTDVFDDPILFSDVDKFLGISREVSTALYKVGRLTRIRKAARSEAESSWFWQDYQAEVDDLDLHIEQQLSNFESAKMRTVGVTNLDHYNYSLVQSAKLFLLCNIKDQEKDTPEVVKTIDEILESCAAVPVESTVAKFMVFPIFTAGMQTTRRLHQDFVRNRLVALQNYYFVANLPDVIERLESAWQNRWSFVQDGKCFLYQCAAAADMLTANSQQNMSILPLF